MKRIKDKFDMDAVSEKLDKLVGVVQKFSSIAEKIPNLFIQAGVAKIGFDATRNIGGSLAALIALKMAQGGNLAGGIAGVATLTGLGVGSVMNFTNTSDPIYTDPLDPTEITTSEKQCIELGGTIIAQLPFSNPNSFCRCKLP